MLDPNPCSSGRHALRKCDVRSASHKITRTTGTDETRQILHRLRRRDPVLGLKSRRSGAFLRPIQRCRLRKRRLLANCRVTRRNRVKNTDPSARRRVRSRLPCRDGLHRRRRESPNRQIQPRIAHNLRSNARISARRRPIITRNQRLNARWRPRKVRPGLRSNRRVGSTLVGKRLTWPKSRASIRKSLRKAPRTRKIGLFGRCSRCSRRPSRCRGPNLRRIRRTTTWIARCDQTHQAFVRRGLRTVGVRRPLIQRNLRNRLFHGLVRAASLNRLAPKAKATVRTRVSARQIPASSIPPLKTITGVGALRADGANRVLGLGRGRRRFRSRRLGRGRRRFRSRRLGRGRRRLVTAAATAGHRALPAATEQIAKEVRNSTHSRLSTQLARTTLYYTKSATTSDEASVSECPPPASAPPPSTQAAQTVSECPDPSVHGPRASEAEP